MDDKGSLLERLRCSLTDLEACQRVTGGTAVPDFFGPVPGEPLSTEAARGGAGPGPAGHAGGPNLSDPDADDEPYIALSADWQVLSKVKGRLAPTFAFAAEVTAIRGVSLATLAELDLVESANQLGRMQQAREVMLVRVVTELESRGVVAPGGLSRVDWLRTLDTTLTAGQAKAVAIVAAAFTEPRWQALRSAVTGESLPETGDDDGNAAVDSGSDTDEAASAAALDLDGSGGLDGSDASGGTEPRARVSVAKAAAIIDFYERLRKVADSDELEQAVAHLREQAGAIRFEALHQLARQLADQVRPPKDNDEHDRGCRNSIGLWFSPPNASGMVHLKGLFDPEGAAMIKSAIDPLSSPRPLTEPDRVEADGTTHRGRVIQPDERPPHQRRAEALLELIARAVSAPAGMPLTDKAKVVVTIDYDSMADRVRQWAARHAGSFATPGASSAGRAGATSTANMPTSRTTHRDTTGARPASTTSGVCLTGDVLSPATVRRLACDAAIVPLVLGSQGQPLDVGRQERLVTRAMRTALWQRDRGCTFPGCSMPPEWTDAHHVTHWADGGETSTANLALLCRRHHTYVHEKSLTAEVESADVTWHTWQQWRVDWPTPRPPPSPPADADPHERDRSTPLPDQNLDQRRVELNRALC